MNQVIAGTLSGTELNVVLLNNGQTFVPSPHSNVRHHDVFDSLARNGGGQFQCRMGECDVRIDHDNGSAVYGIKLSGESVALCTLVWESYAEGALWQVLLTQHWAMHEAKGLSFDVSKVTRPKSVPWVAISVTPSFLAKVENETVSAALTVLAEISTAILRQQERLAAAN